MLLQADHERHWHFEQHHRSMVTPYEGTGEMGSITFDVKGIAGLLIQLNEAGLNPYVRAVGERASHFILGGVELIRRELRTYGIDPKRGLRAMRREAP